MKESYEDIINKMYSSKENIEDIILELKKRGASQIETVKALIFTLHLPLKEADRLVFNSNAWAEIRETNEQLREEFYKNES